MIEAKIGQIIRYASGPSALMRVTTISKGHGGPHYGDRYWGPHYYGGTQGAYAVSCSEATPSEIVAFEREESLIARRNGGHTWKQQMG